MGKYVSILAYGMGYLLLAIFVINVLSGFAYWSGGLEFWLTVLPFLACSILFFCLAHIIELLEQISRKK